VAVRCFEQEPPEMELTPNRRCDLHPVHSVLCRRVGCDELADVELASRDEWCIVQDPADNGPELMLPDPLLTVYLSDLA
jgi:hypothetical protein